MRFSVYFLGAAFWLAGLGAALASETVTSPGVVKGEVSAQSKSEYTIDDDDARDGAWKEKVALGYGVTSFWGTEVEGKIQQSGSAGEATEFSSLDWKNKFRLSTQDNVGLDTAIRLSYGLNTSGNPDDIEVKFIAGRTDGNFQHRANLAFVREVGGGADNAVEWDVSWSSRYKVSIEFQPGFEIYSTFGEIGDEGSFDDQDHRIGPVFYGQLGKGVSYDAGYLFGFSDGAPDGTVKVILGVKW